MQDPLADTQVLTVTTHEAQTDTAEYYKERLVYFLREFKDGQRFKYYQQLQNPQTQRSIDIELLDLPQHLYERFTAHPYEMRELLCQAVNELLPRTETGDADQDNRIAVNILGAPLTSALPISALNATHLDRLITCHGLLVGASRVGRKIHKAVAVCRSCGNRITVPVPFGISQERLPTQCQRTSEEVGGVVQKCPSNSFVLQLQQCEFVDQQVLKLQDINRNTLTIRLEGGLADPDLLAGASVLITGVRSQDCIICFGIQRIQRDSYLNVLNNATFSGNDTYKQFAANDPMKRLSEMIAPHLHGLVDVKKALACQAVGGVTKMASGSRLRGEIHILLVSDPGAGKSELLRAACGINRIAISATGLGASAAGLTAAVVRDPETGALVLEGGALAQADGGLLCIDEFDKCRAEDVVALHEAMEQGTVSVAKASAHAVLAARAAVLAAANPTLGRYDELVGFSEQLGLQETIASRFDLIFVLRDIADVERDRLVVKAVGDSLRGLGMGRPEDNAGATFVREYLAAARRLIPQLTDPAVSYLRDAWVSLRRESRGPRATIRQLEALVRLSEAIARLHLRERVTEADARAAVELQRGALAGAQEDGAWQAGGAGARSLAQVTEAQRLLRQVLPLRTPQHGAQVLRQLRAAGLGEGAVMRAVDLMHADGQLQRLRSNLLVRVK